MISVTFKRRAGRTEMVIDCADFHKYLRECGVQDDGRAFKDRPACTRIIDTTAHKIGSDLLLTLQNPVTVALAEHYTRPVTQEVFRKLGESVQGVAEAIVEHYRPIDVVVKILPKATVPQTAAEFGPVTES